jgi:hypothetical protein
VSNDLKARAFDRLLIAVKAWQEAGGEVAVESLPDGSRTIQVTVRGPEVYGLDDTSSEETMDLAKKLLETSFGFLEGKTLPPPPPCEHEWDETGERCVKCGDKDWMVGGTPVDDTDRDEGG